MMARKFETPVIAGIGLLIAFHVVSASLSIQNIRQLKANGDWVIHTQEVLEIINDVQADVVDAETGARGFIITGRDEYLEPYNAAIERVDSDFQKLKLKTADRPGRADQIQSIEASTRTRLATLSKSISQRRADPTGEKKIPITGVGRVQMIEIRKQLSDLKKKESELLYARRSQSSSAFQTAIVTGIASAVVGLSVIALAVGLLIRSLMAQQRNSEVLAEQTERLRTTLASIGDGVITVDLNACVMSINAVAEELTGWTSNDAFGKSLTKIFQIVNEDTREPVENPALKSLASGAIVGLANHTILISRSGKEYFIDDSAAPIRDSSGTTQGVILVFRDISQKRSDEKALIRSERELSDFFDNATIGLHWVGPDGIILRANKAELTMLGYTEDEYIGRHISEFHVDQPVIEDILACLTSGETVREYPAKLRCKDGSIRDVLIDSSALFEDGVFVHTRCFTRDITEIKRAEKATALLAAIVEDSDDAIVSKTLQGQIQSWNAGAERLYGFTAEEAIGQAINMIIPPELQMEEVMILERLSRGERVDHFETERLKKDGYRIFVSLSISPIRDRDGNIIGASKVARDITDKKKSELQTIFLSEASATLAGIVDYESTLRKVAGLAVPSFADWCTVDIVQSPTHLKRVAVIHSDPSKVQLATDLQRRVDLGPDSKSVAWEIVRTAKSQMVTEITEEMMDSLVEDTEILSIVKGLGLRSYIGVPLSVRGKVLGVITFVSAESGRKYGATELAVAEDLANRAAVAIENARLFEEARQADRRKDEFLATLAHELRNPLAPLRSSLALVKRSDDQGEALRNARELMERQVEQMVHLVDDLLDLSRITRDKLEMRFQETELRPIIDHAVEIARPFADREEDVIEVRLPEEPIYLHADPMRLAQVFSNLLNNACKFTKPHGRIVISAEIEGGNVRVTVEDNGIGIPAEKIQNIFEMFSQVDAFQDQAKGGLGIGLTLVKRIVELHGGSINASSQGLGLGSEFTAVLPTSEHQEVRKEVKNAKKAPVTSDLRVLIVDDNKDAAVSLGMLLKLTGNEIRIEHDGEAAVRAVPEFSPDVILLDIGLPKIDGYEACHRIRKLDEGKSTYIVALTGWGQEEDRRKSVEAGFDCHLVKPVDTDILIGILAEQRKKDSV